MIFDISIKSLLVIYSLEKEMATYSNILAWELPEDLAGYSPWGHKESDMT